jgi:hypothetical protein
VELVGIEKTTSSENRQLLICRQGKAERTQLPQPVVQRDQTNKTNKVAGCASASPSSRIVSMLQRRLAACLVLVALLAATTAADASLCNANCAFAALERSHDQHLYHAPSSPMTAARYHHHDGLSSDATASSLPLPFQLPQCSVYSQFQALTTAFRVSLGKKAFCAERVTVDRTLPSTSAVSLQCLFLPSSVHSPPGSNQHSFVAPLRV